MMRRLRIILAFAAFAAVGAVATAAAGVPTTDPGEATAVRN